MRPNNTQTLEFGADKGLLQGFKQKEQMVHTQKTQTQGWFSGVFKGNIWDEGCSMWTFSDWLVVRLQVDVSRTAIIHPSSQSGV